MRRFTAIGLVGLLALGFSTLRSEEARAQACGEFEPMRSEIVDMAFKKHHVFADLTLGAATSYEGPDGTLTCYRFDRGFDRISQDLLDDTTHLAIQNVESLIHFLDGEVTKVMSPWQARTIGDVTLEIILFVSEVSGAQRIDFLATGTDGRCLYIVRYTPDVTSLDAQGRDADGLVVFERFNRALDGLAPYFGG